MLTGIITGGEPVPEGGFRARATNSLLYDEIKALVDDVVEGLLGEGGQVPQSFEARKNELCSEIFGRNDEYISVVQYIRYRDKFDREKFILEFPELADKVDDFCHILRMRVALAMHPEKIDEVINLLRENGEEVFRPGIFRRYGKDVLKGWFDKNCRGKGGKIDWQFIYEKIKEQYDCGFEYLQRREAFTKETGLQTIRSLLDDAIEEKGFWHPWVNIEEKDKSVYIFITSLSEFRISAQRPDLESRSITKDTRPNWFKIARELGSKYLMTMRIGRGEGINELEYRDFGQAIDQLNDTLEGLGFPEWNSGLLHRENRNLLNWFGKHIVNDQGSIDWDLILSFVKEEVKNSFLR